MSNLCPFIKTLIMKHGILFRLTVPDILYIFDAVKRKLIRERVRYEKNNPYDSHSDSLQHGSSEKYYGRIQRQQ